MRVGHFILVLVVLAGSVRAQQTVTPEGQPATVKVHGVAEDTDGGPVSGVKFEFRLRGEPKSEPMVTGPDGKYEVTVQAGMYEVLVHLPDPKVAPYDGQVWLAGQPEFVLNARVAKQKFAGTLEYDLLGDWRVVNGTNRPIPLARAVFEAQDQHGRRTRFPVYLATIDGDQETDGQVQADPAGRIAFRVNEAHILPNRTVALVISVDAPGFHPRSVHVYPAYQFSETGHLYAVYPDEYQIEMKKQGTSE